MGSITLLTYLSIFLGKKKKEMVSNMKGGRNPFRPFRHITSMNFLFLIFYFLWVQEIRHYGLKLYILNHY